MSTKKKTQFFYNDPLISKSMQESSFRAVKNLIQAQRNIQTIKNRIKVLQKNEQKNINKINLQKQQIQKITMVKNQHLEELRKMKVTKMERERMIEQMKAKNQQWRKDHLDKLETVKAEIFEEKAKEYTQTVQQRSLNQSRILQNKSNMLQKKQQTRNNVVLLEQKSRQNILKFYEDKTSSIHAKTNLQISKINKVREKKQKQLSDFSAVEMEMIERHSQSQVAYKQMKSKLDAMLGRIRLEKRKGIKQMKSSVHRQGKENLFTLDGA